MPAKVVAGFVDETVNRLPDLDTQKEVALALVPLGYAPQEAAPPSPDVVPLGLKTAAISSDDLDFPTVREMHEAASLTGGEEAASWRGEALL